MKILLLTLLVFPAISYSVDFSKPTVLEIKKYRSVNGKLELRFIRENPRLVMRIGAGNKETNDFFEKVMKSDINKLNCDGDFFPMFDQLGMQYMHVNSIKACVDEEGDVVAHSINMTALTDAQVAVSKKYVEDNLKVQPAAVLAPNINDSSKPKDVDNSKAGIFSPKLKALGITK